MDLTQTDLGVLFPRLFSHPQPKKKKKHRIQAVVPRFGYDQILTRIILPGISQSHFVHIEPTPIGCPGHGFRRV